LGQQNGIPANVVVRPHSHFIEWGRANGFNLLIDPMPWPSRRSPWSTPWHALRVARWAQRVGTQIIHCNEHDIYPFARIIKRMLGVPIVCHVRYKLRRGYAEWAFGGKRAPDALLWTSYQQKADCADAIAGIASEERQHVLRLGVGLNAFGTQVEAGRRLRHAWGIGEAETLVGIPSPLRPRKRIHEFVEMMKRLAPRQPQLVGVIAGGDVAGDEAYRADIERQISAARLGRRLRWVGYLDPVEPFHHACDISVSTSEYETFGNSVCEAMACGKPVAAYRGGSVAEVVGDAGLIVETGDLDGLTAAVERLILDRDLRRSLGAKARERVAQEFDPAKSFQQLQSIYESLLSNRNACRCP
jgi:glycosyltransferase involved in cell wall biosynthesis